jgi:multicomponent Na+:H+ antiporter subunit D
MSNLLMLPVAVPLVTAAMCLVAWNRPELQRVLSIFGSVFHLLMCVAVLAEVWGGQVLSLQLGEWPAPYGITFVADRLSGIMLTLAGVVGILVVLHSLSSIDRQRVSFGYHPLVQVLLLGVSGAFLTGDFFNLFVWFEVLLISSFVLMALGGEKAQMQGAFKYVAINLVASAVFLAGLGLLYGTLGTLNMAHAATLIPELEYPGFMGPVAMMFLISFAIKAGLFPFYFWLPASYHTPPIVVTALFAGLLTKVGIYAILRSFSLIFVVDTEVIYSLIVWLASITMVLGGIGAVIQRDLRRVVSFNMLVGIGCMALGIGLANAAGFTATVLYTIHSAIVTTALYMLCGLVRERSGTYDITQMGGLYAGQPRLALGFLVVSLAMAGLPPLSGFFPKVALFESGLIGGHYWAMAALVISSLLSLASFVRVWSWVFWRPGTPLRAKTRGTAYAACVAGALLTLSLPLFMGPLAKIARSAGASLLQPEAYIRQVLAPEVRQ